MAITRTSLSVEMSLALHLSLLARTAAVSRTSGSAIQRMTVEMDRMKVIFALRKLALTSNSLAHELATAFHNLGCATVMTIVSISRSDI